MGNEVAPPVSRRAAVEAFLEKRRLQRQVHPGTRGRLIFALDATASRQPTWDAACQLQAEMFDAVTGIGGLDIQLVYYRGPDECQWSRWISDGRTLANTMAKITCRAGHTQIGKVLAHAKRENGQQKVQAVVFVGDCMEEKLDSLCDAASELGRQGLPCFLFQEGDDPDATHAFRKIAALTGGAHCQFDAGAARQLAELLRAAAAYATGGLTVLENLKSSSAPKLLLAQMGRNR